MERWEQVKELLHQAMPLSSEERVRFLDEACSSDAALRAEVVSLLAAGEDVRTNFLQSMPHRADSVSTLEAGQVFAQRFHLVRKLGEGGMGQVWMAEQTSPVRRQVALKLIKAGMYDEAVVQRFQSERQSLAIMDHPAIAKVFDAGATPQGQPYFVMEYVPGLPITEYCDQHKLGIRERLELFIQACEGVQHAHQKATIHRDLKPANILVVDVDGKPTPRIIDFGLAKATTPHVAGETMFTQVGHFVGTPAYMSPEQADPAVQDIDTRTDVYSLGVVLYVLLVGMLPFETKPREKQPLNELLRKLREEEPPRPSSKVSADKDTSAAAALARGTEPRQLLSLLRGDLDWITMKALEKDRSRRYGAPSELAADLRRYLNHEPVVARPASATYRVQKYARRHRVGVGVAAVLVLLLAAFAVVEAVELRRITRERDRANRERDRAARITDFMTGMFKVSDPSEARGNSVTAREILDKASKDMGAGLAKDPEVQSQMMQVMASTYQNLGLYARAHELAQHALDSRRSLFGPDDPRTLESMAQLGWILDREGHYGDGEKLERQALEGERRILGSDDPRTIETIDYLAGTLEGLGHYDEAEKLAREESQLSTRKLGPESAEALRAMNTLGGSLWNQARYAEADQEYRQMIVVARRVMGPDDPQTLSAMSNLATTLAEEGRLPEAVQMDREVLTEQRRVLGADHQKTTLTMDNLAALLVMEGHLAEAEKLSREVLAIRIRALGPDHPDTLSSKTNLAIDLFDEGHTKDAETMQREALASFTRVLGPDNPDTMACRTSVARTLNREGRYAEAEKLARSSFSVQLVALGPGHPQTLDSLQQLGRAMAYSHRYAEAVKLFHDVIEKQNAAKGQGDPTAIWFAFACVAVAANRPDDAMQYFRKAVSLGYNDANDLMTEDDLKSFHQNPDFQKLVAELKHAPTKAQNQ
jgi:serine/threonine protein kinase/tetratricopeptide (TPR) repeat protein